MSSDVVAEEGIHKFRSELNQIYWGLECSQREFKIQDDESRKAHKWILKGKYKDSRGEVIGKAIGDCVAGKNEFKNKSASKCIFFEKTLPETYEHKHWNAVILYNYVHEAINGDELPQNNNDYFEYVGNVEDVLKDKMKTIKKHYMGYCIERCKDKDKAAQLLQDLNGNLNKAVKDIQEYVNALNLPLFLSDFRTSKQAYESNRSVVNLAPYIDEGSDEKGKIFHHHIFFTCYTSRTNCLRYKPIFRYDNKVLYLGGLTTVEQVVKADETTGQEYWINVIVLEADELEELKTRGKWLIDRLKKFTFIKLATQELLDKWGQEDDEVERGEENLD